MLNLLAITDWRGNCGDSGGLSASIFVSNSRRVFTRHLATINTRRASLYQQVANTPSGISINIDWCGIYQPKSVNTSATPARIRGRCQAGVKTKTS